MPGTGDTSVTSYNFFHDGTVQGAGTYAANEHAFVNNLAGAFNTGINFTSHSVIIANDGANDLFFSFDGINDHGRVLKNEKVSQDFRRAKKVWIRGTPGDAFRFWAW